MIWDMWVTCSNTDKSSFPENTHANRRLKYRLISRTNLPLKQSIKEYRYDSFSVYRSCYAFDISLAGNSHVRIYRAVCEKSRNASPVELLRDNPEEAISAMSCHAKILHPETVLYFIVCRISYLRLYILFIIFQRSLG